MINSTAIRPMGILVCSWFISACAATGDLVSTPEVQLTEVQVTSLDVSGQVFRLGFDVSNPNPFPLPVTGVSYGVELDGQRFATGKTSGSFVVPARGSGDFAISVELDLLRSAPRLLYSLSDGVRDAIPYSLEGSLGIDIPFTEPLKFRSTGEIRILAK